MLFRSFALQPFTMRLQSVVRTFVDKVFAPVSYTHLCKTRLWFQECSYNNKTTLSPLDISELSEEEELEFINVYLEAYLNNVADDDTKVKYSSVLPDTVDQIYSNFKTALKEECDRPLFVACLLYTSH